MHTFIIGVQLLVGLKNCLRNQLKSLRTAGTRMIATQRLYDYSVCTRFVKE